MRASFCCRAVVVFGGLLVVALVVAVLADGGGGVVVVRAVAPSSGGASFNSALANVGLNSDAAEAAAAAGQFARDTVDLSSERSRKWPAPLAALLLAITFAVS